MWRSTRDRLIVSLLKRVIRNQGALSLKIDQTTDYLEGLIIMSNQDLQNEIDDLKSANVVIGAGVESLVINNKIALAEIEKLKASGVDENQLANLKSAVDGAQAIAEKFKAVADPDADTPPIDSIPSPVGPDPDVDVDANGVPVAGSDDPSIPKTPPVDGEPDSK